MFDNKTPIEMEKVVSVKMEESEAQDEQLMTVHSLYSGRINRVSFITGPAILGSITFMMSSAISLMYELAFEDAAFDEVIFPFNATIAIILFIAYIPSFLIRRVHDLGKGSWYFLIFLVPVINIIAAMILAFIPGQKEDNLYGKPPARGVNLLKLFCIINSTHI